MGRAVLLACLPWFALLLASAASGYLLVRWNRSRLCLRRALDLHRDQFGGVQSLSFVLTLPLFIMILLLIVQVSQLMVAIVMVHYAAYSAARTAIVWIPAQMMAPEGPNCVSYCYLDPEAPNQVMPILDPDDPAYGPAEGGLTFLIEPGSEKYGKITTAAGMALLPICPSRDVGLSLPAGASYPMSVIESAYEGIAPSSTANAKIPVRLRNKLAYAMAHTSLQVRFYHKNTEPPLMTYLKPYDIGQFYANELGWQDTVTVTVYHDLALLPGPGRLLAKPTRRPDGSIDEVSQHIQQSGNVYTYPLKASATMGNEGEIPVIPYVQN
jgi:hypothetical protein